MGIELLPFIHKLTYLPLHSHTQTFIYFTTCLNPFSLYYILMMQLMSNTSRWWWFNVYSKKNIYMAGVVFSSVGINALHLITNNYNINCLIVDHTYDRCQWLNLCVNLWWTVLIDAIDITHESSTLSIGQWHYERLN